MQPGTVTPSGMYKAGTILLLVGAILHAIGTLALAGLGIVYIMLEGADGGGPRLFAFMGYVYLGLAALTAVGTVFGFLAHAKASRGDAHGGWVNGLVASLLPPLQVITLLGAIFCLVSPEGEAAKRSRVAASSAS